MGPLGKLWKLIKGKMPIDEQPDVLEKIEFQPPNQKPTDEKAPKSANQKKASVGKKGAMPND